LGKRDDERPILKERGGRRRSTSVDAEVPLLTLKYRWYQRSAGVVTPREGRPAYILQRLSAFKPFGL
jgi:hypothetical protein